jgi:hypothetical protein
MCGKIQIFNNRSDIYPTDTHLFEAVNKIFSFVCEASEIAYNRSALQISNPKLRNWAFAIDEYFQGKTGVHFMNATYGYAVEEIVNIKLKPLSIFGINGYVVLLQAKHGNTIPDIVLKKDYKEVAWLDITSERNVGHIYKKNGDGWKTAPFVAELLYPSLDLTRLRTANEESLGTRAHALNIYRQNSIYEKKVEAYFYHKFIAAMESIRNISEIEPASVALAIENSFEVTFPENRKHPAIKSMLQRFIANYPNSNTTTFCKWILSHNYYVKSAQDRWSANNYILRSYNKTCNH